MFANEHRSRQVVRHTACLFEYQQILCKNKARMSVTAIKRKEKLLTIVISFGGFLRIIGFSGSARVLSSVQHIEGLHGFES